MAKAEEPRDTQRVREPGDTQATLTELEKAIIQLCIACGSSNSRPLRIIVIGRNGSGKSSFINSVAAALARDHWREHATTGDLGGGAPITIVNQRFGKCCNGNKARYRHVNLPTLIDVAGLLDEDDQNMAELLRLLFYGHIPENEPIMTAYEYCRSHSIQQVRSRYNRCYPAVRIDRVVFVASAADTLPERLMTCVLNAARPSQNMNVRRTVPLYGVLTKMDMVDTSSDDFQNIKCKFKKGLGLNQPRLLVCSNYCDHIDPEGLRKRQLDPYIDLPYIYFLQQLCEPAVAVIREDEVLPGAQRWWLVQQAQDRWAQAEPLLRDLLLANLITLVLLLLFSALWPIDASLCRNAFFDSSLCEQGSPWVRLTAVAIHIICALVWGLAFFYWRRLYRP